MNNGATVLVLGGGGREHALAWALARSPDVGRVLVAPGNAGTDWPAATGCAPCEALPLPADDVPTLLALARREQPDLTVVGPEALLAAGVADAFQAAGLRVFGPTQAAARIESSKAFAKDLMQQQGIPTAQHHTFTEAADALAFLAQQPDSQPFGWVVKADGLAAGKGVLLCASRAEAEAAVQRVLVAREFGAAGATLVLEERLSGKEVSLLAFCDGHTVQPMPPARDHKRVGEGDQGPNTGGMGAYAPAPDISAAQVETWVQTIMQPTVAALAARGTPYMGVLYAGLMLTPAGMRVLEFNCRFGDPETQAIVPLLDPAGPSLYAILHACTSGTLHELTVRWQPGACATVVLAAPGYPGDYPRGLPIDGLDATDGLVFHAGTARQAGQPVTAGGRVLAVSATGADLAAALERAYAQLAPIQFTGMHYRRDIGRHDL